MNPTHTRQRQHLHDLLLTRPRIERRPRVRLDPRDEHRGDYGRDGEVDQLLEFAREVGAGAGGGAEPQVGREIAGVEVEERLPLRGPDAVEGEEGGFEGGRGGGVGGGHGW